MQNNNKTIFTYEALRLTANQTLHHTNVCRVRKPTSTQPLRVLTTTPPCQSKKNSNHAGKGILLICFSICLTFKPFTFGLTNKLYTAPYKLTLANI